MASNKSWSQLVTDEAIATKQPFVVNSVSNEKTVVSLDDVMSEELAKQLDDEDFAGGIEEAMAAIGGQEVTEESIPEMTEGFVCGLR
ncbi:unnamed protein product [Medioppia subpectinata]|uniref:Uncharacterized protein n=1 Tax=Medioppia subpectinata TaxID=1979941 RepID=A0A7R9LXX1_9ACAR|nr:unnamed protein product [Medioppia subpectinata]CAG2122694.1 unnamed protein product [Medioppia subpectinata]